MWSGGPARDNRESSQPALVEIGAGTISAFLPSATMKDEKSTVDDNGRRLRDAIETARAMRASRQDIGSEEKPANQQKGYAAPSRRDMDRLFESKQ